MRFNDDFVFGTATASYQVEGAHAEGGRTPSIWDTQCRTPGKVHGGDTGDVACDQYHRWDEDLEIIKSLGLQAYRFSISWSRVIPDGVGEVNPEGVAYYRRVCETLKAAGISPVVTLYHWDLPQVLEDKGGWTLRETAYAFADYAQKMARELGDVVDVWSTLNEPWCSSYLGYGSGVHAPGHTDPVEALKAVHHLNLAHGLASRALREELGEDVPICLTLNLHVIHPLTDSAADVAAARRIEVVGNEAFLQPVMEGRFPEELREIAKDVTDWSFVLDGDMELCHQVPGILGINYYSTSTVKACDPGEESLSGGHGETGVSPWVCCEDVTFLPPKGLLTDMGWNIEPDGLRQLLVATARRYPGQQLMVTENGAAFPDEVSADRQVHDPLRVNYLRDHLDAVARAIDEGAPVTGYYLWSLLDNFEWSWGYSKRFGMVRVDYDSLERTVKDSAKWYADLVRRRDLGAVGTDWVAGS
ncbi:MULTISPECIES: GH1 family beta-glucosidase [Luteococcus]|uniref:Beta-glucosidase n=1 Tax=Luteococcus japonicus LSP_Lj1 TaxID=1255658 RepID=A0A1R4KCJ7_9ACTN|nr:MULTISPECIES: GH1 family beta-glucosidase [Luteococcus]MDN5562621.1 GH1 family beta-glucosidase [Luteococcus sp.]SJN42039.1 Beta-glucosidase [Luteococcus japonicus LSP_Lj1]